MNGNARLQTNTDRPTEVGCLKENKEPTVTGVNLMEERNSERLVIVDVDTGVDDTLAILVLLAADAVGLLKLKAITCVAGNTALDNVCTNTLRVLRAAKRLDIPVFAGAGAPLISKRSGSLYHGSDGFGDLDLPDPPSPQLIQKENAVSALHRLCTQNKGKVDLICLAPLTNIALAMRTYSDFAGSIKSLHIMGGNKRAVGNATDAAEFNFFTDPEAVHIVLESAQCPVQIVPWETCTEHPIEPAWLENVLGKTGGEAMKLLVAAENKIHEDWIVCDQVSVACYLKPELIRSSSSWDATVELQGTRTRGQMVLDHLRRRYAQGEDGNVTIVDAYDLDGFKELLLWAADRW